MCERVGCVRERVCVCICMCVCYVCVRGRVRIWCAVWSGTVLLGGGERVYLYLYVCVHVCVREGVGCVCERGRDLDVCV